MREHEKRIVIGRDNEILNKGIEGIPDQIRKKSQSIR